MITIADLIQADTIKLIFPNSQGDNPIDMFDDPECIKSWMFYQYPAYQFNFSCQEIVVGLVKLTKNLFVLASVEEVLGKINVTEGKGYTSATVAQYDDYRGRLIIKYDNRGTQLKRDFKELAKDMEVYELLPKASRLF